jgi:hypothetical protein
MPVRFGSPSAKKRSERGMHMNTFKRIGFIGQIVTVIGFAAALSACGDQAASPSASATTAPAAIDNTVSPPVSSPATAATPAPTPAPASTSTSSAAPTVAPQSVTLAWTPPTQNTDGSALTNLSGYTIYYGTSASALTQKISVNSVGLTDFVVENLTAGTWYFQIVAINAAGTQSGPSSVASVTI